jgi:hypothetical protein
MTWLNSRLTDAGIIGSGTAKQSVLAKRVNQRRKGVKAAYIVEGTSSVKH